jgi:RNA polymerase sigma factor (sigma-70 family)
MTASTPATTATSYSFTATDPRDAPYAQLLSHPRVRTYLEEQLAKLELQPADARDLLGQTLEVLWKRRDSPNRPDSLERVLGLGGTVLKGKVVDYFRHKAVTDRRIVDAPEVPRDPGDPARGKETSGADQPNTVDEIAPPRSINPRHQLEAKRKLAFVRDVADKVGLTDDDLEVMQAIDAGEVTLEQAAAERGLKSSTLRVRLHRIRNKLRSAWAKHLAIRSVTLLILLMVTFFVLYALALGAARRWLPPPPRPERTHEMRERSEGDTKTVVQPRDDKHDPE